MTKPKHNPNPIDIAIALIQKADQFLIAQRFEDAHLGGYWEFPGGKVESGETPQQAVVREVQEELAITVTVQEILDIIEYTYPTHTVRLHCFLCHQKTGAPQALGCQQFKWVKKNQLAGYSFPKANESLLQLLLRL